VFDVPLTQINVYPPALADFQMYLAKCPCDISIWISHRHSSYFPNCIHSVLLFHTFSAGLREPVLLSPRASVFTFSPSLTSLKLCHASLALLTLLASPPCWSCAHVRQVGAWHSARSEWSAIEKKQHMTPPSFISLFYLLLLLQAHNAVRGVETICFFLVLFGVQIPPWDIKSSWALPNLMKNVSIQKQWKNFP
jgi:hypothetical protein